MGAGVYNLEPSNPTPQFYFILFYFYPLVAGGGQTPGVERGGLCCYRVPFCFFFFFCRSHVGAVS